jgi:hypothetical protein
MGKLQDILDRIDQSEIKKAQDEFIEKGYDKDPDKLPAFEIDDKIHTVPYRTLREYLQTGKATEPSQRPVFRNRISVPSEPTSYQPKQKDTSRDFEDGYYWDSNYNYEYMNPESKMRKVLEKIKK